jgi:hypothetical protein
MGQLVPPTARLNASQALELAFLMSEELGKMRGRGAVGAN